MVSISDQFIFIINKGRIGFINVHYYNYVMISVSITIKIKPSELF